MSCHLIRWSWDSSSCIIPILFSRMKDPRYFFVSAMMISCLGGSIDPWSDIIFNCIRLEPSWFPSDFQVSRVDASRLSSSGSFFGRCFGLRPVWKVSSGLLNCSIFSVFNSLRPTFLFYAARSRAAALVCFSLCVCVCGCLSVWLIYSFQSARFSRCFFYWVSLYFTVFFGSTRL